MVDVFTADPVVGADLAAVDWEATPLGDPDGWPQSLRTAVAVLLSSRFPMWMAWGPELTFLCNDAYRRDTLGGKYPWALGRPADVVWAEVWDAVRSRVDGVLATGRGTWDSALQLFLERSGYLEETYHTFSYSALRDETGAVVGMLCVVSEDTVRVVTERRMATLRALGTRPETHLSEERLLEAAADRLAENTEDLPFTLIYLLDADGDAHLAAAGGITPGHRLAPRTLRRGACDPVWPTGGIADGSGQVCALTPAADVPTGSWSVAPTQALVVPLVQSGLPPTGFLVAALNPHRPLDADHRGFVDLVATQLAAGIGNARSFGAQQRRADSLAELDRAKTAFFSNISHELRTPLALMLGPVADLRSRAADAHDVRAHADLDLVHRNGVRLSKLVDTLLDFSRLEAGRMQVRGEPADLAVATADLAAVFRSAYHRAGIALTVDCPPSGRAVLLDGDLWEKVVFNLLSNALKFTFEGSVTVAVRTCDGGVGNGTGHAELTVADTGVGIPAEEMPRLFERFHRVPSARSRSHEGSGIGLALVKELVELHDGTVEADSTEGVGTVFTVRLPLASPATPLPAPTAPRTPAVSDTRAAAAVGEVARWSAPDAAADASPAATRDDGGGDTADDVRRPGVAMRVLVADDNADMRGYLTRLLSGAGHRVEAVADGHEALRRARRDPPDVVLSDVMMPGMDGLALAAALRGDPRTATLPVVLLSARAGQDASVEGLDAGADDYLVKPFSSAELLARLRATVALARSRDHHARWRAALVDSLQEAFFVSDADGAVIEVNAAFAEVLGYGADGVPYPVPPPWWPDAEADPTAHALVAAAFGAGRVEPESRDAVPLTHRDGHRVWVISTAARVTDPDTGRPVTVGTLRDVTAERERTRRQTALAALNGLLAQAEAVDDAVCASLGLMRELFEARRVTALLWTDDGPPRETVSGEVAADDAAPPDDTVTALRDSVALTTRSRAPGGVGVTVAHPRGVLVLWVERADGQDVPAADVRLLRALADRLGTGLGRLHTVDQQRETALALQLAMLSPVDPSHGFVARYEPASRPLQVGGDWYDLVELDDGRVAVVVGDCVGHGLSAATVMGQLRSACRALLLDHGDPRPALTALDRFAARLPGALCTTAFCGVLDTEAGVLTYASAGHPPPVLVGADGSVVTLDGARGLPLGVRPDRARACATVTLPPRSTLLLYTDGLVERRAQPMDAGIVRAGDAVRDGADRPLDDLGRQVMAELAPPRGYSDDVALLLYRQPAPLRIDFAADPARLAGVRHALRDWLRRADVSDDQTQAVLIAVGEAVANAIEHGHRDRAGTVSLEAAASADRLRVVVTDTGSWKPPRVIPDNARGRGMALMHGLMSDVAVDHDGAGTTVTLVAQVSS